MSAAEKMGTVFGCAGCVSTDALGPSTTEQERGSQAERRKWRYWMKATL